jgi:hypothetical protein
LLNLPVLAAFVQFVGAIKPSIQAKSRLADIRTRINAQFPLNNRFTLMRDKANTCIGAIHLSFPQSSLDFEVNKGNDFGLG